MTTDPPWPADYGLPPDHCGDVLRGAYEIPYDPPTPPVILDLGANVGAFARWASKRWPGSIIHCYEPQPQNFELLKRTERRLREMLYFAGDIICHQVAVSDKAGTIALHEGQFNCGEWSLLDTGAGKGSVNVDVISAADLPKADILKIDVEGAEPFILSALTGRLTEFSAVMMEVHNGQWIDPIKAMFRRAGFSLTGELNHSEHRAELKFLRTRIVAPVLGIDAPVPMLTSKHTDRKRVLIATPAKGGIPWYWEEVKDQVLRMDHPEFEIDFCSEAGNSAINLTRNMLADHARREKYWKLIMLDNDHMWTIEHLFRLLAHKEPIVGGSYCRKQAGAPTWLAVHTPEIKMREDGLLQCDFIGTGVLAVEVAVFDKMAEMLPEREFEYEDENHKKSTMVEFFPIGLVGPNTAAGKLGRIRKLMTSTKAYSTDVLADVQAIFDDKSRGNARLLGEDYHFCHLARKCGFKLYVDTQCIVPHVGPICHPVTPDKVAVPTQIPSHELNMEDW